MSNKNLEQELISLSRQKWDWMKEGKFEPLDELIHQDAMFVHMGATFSKEEELEVMRTGRIQAKSVEIQKASVRFFGTTAILLNTVRLTAVVDGKEVTNPFVVTEVYVQEGSSWKLASLSFTRLLTS